MSDIAPSTYPRIPALVRAVCRTLTVTPAGILEDVFRNVTDGGNRREPVQRLFVEVIV
jgi:hypothetical protein